MTLPDLFDQFISDNYSGILQTGNVTLSAGVATPVYDGRGNKSPLNLGTDVVKTGTVSLPTAPGPVGSIMRSNGVDMPLDLFFPVGAIYLSTSNVNPSNVFGGVWAQVGQGQFLVGVGNGVDQNGALASFTAGVNSGEYLHTLTTSEMAQHQHFLAGEGDSNTSIRDNVNGPIAYRGGVGSDPVFDYILALSPALPTAGLSSPSGQSQPHNNLPPSFGVYMWNRTA